MQTAFLILLATATRAWIIATHPWLVATSRLSCRHVFGTPCQPVSVDFSHIRSNGLPGLLSIIVAEIMPTPIGRVGKGENRCKLYVVKPFWTDLAPASSVPFYSNLEVAICDLKIRPSTTTL
jgi:hypothetical protein